MFCLLCSPNNNFFVQTFSVENDLVALGYVFYSIAANDVNKPTKRLKSNDLTGLRENQQPSALNLINLLTLKSSWNESSVSLSQLFRHPFSPLIVKPHEICCERTSAYEM